MGCLDAPLTRVALFGLGLPLGFGWGGPLGLTETQLKSESLLFHYVNGFGISCHCSAVQVYSNDCGYKRAAPLALQTKGLAGERAFGKSAALRSLPFARPHQNIAGSIGFPKRTV